MDMFRRTFAEVNLDHVAHNFEVLKAAFPNTSFLCPMVKANAYGHGDVAIALCLQQAGARHLGVCLIEEALLLRRGGVTANILVFRGFDREGAEQLLANNLTPVVSTWDQLEALEEMAKTPVKIHLKFNTGMNRLGFSIEEAEKLFDKCWRHPKIQVEGVLTHLFNGEDADELDGDSADQLGKLLRILLVFKPLNPLNHSLNSAGILNALIVREQKNPQHILNQVQWGLRPGLMVYGFNPLKRQDILPLKPVMTLKSVASTYRMLKVGEVVSYGGTWKAKRDSVVAIVPIGYADGYHRILSNKAEVLFNGYKVPVVGTICMDFLMVDVTDAIHGCDLNDLRDKEIILFGKSDQGQFISAEELAHRAQTITWEILTSVGERVPRVYVGDWAKRLGVAN
ncbi:MAG: alanine racemase [Bdellovibrionaceae bacterium]|nr:alanine racemase [Pseudobdellovibrionaceae bacterium]